MFEGRGDLSWCYVSSGVCGGEEICSQHGIRVGSVCADVMDAADECRDGA